MSRHSHVYFSKHLLQFSIADIVAKIKLLYSLWYHHFHHGGLKTIRCDKQKTAFGFLKFNTKCGLRNLVQQIIRCNLIFEFSEPDQPVLGS